LKEAAKSSNEGSLSAIAILAIQSR